MAAEQQQINKVYLAHSYWRFQSIFGWTKAEWNRAESIQFMAVEQQNDGRGSKSIRAAEEQLQLESVSLFLFIFHSGSPPQSPL